MKGRAMWAGIAVIVIVLLGGVYYSRSKSAAQPQRSRDLGFALLLSIRTLESEPGTQLTKEQIAGILPFVKALKDIPSSDAQAVAAIVRAVADSFTPAQKAALEEARKRFLNRQSPQGQGAQAGSPSGADPGSGGVSGVAGDPGTGGSGFGGQRTGFGPGRPPGARGGAGGALSDDQRAQLRTRQFERMISYLERRMK